MEGNDFRFEVAALSTDTGKALGALLGCPVLLELLTAESHDELCPFQWVVIGSASRTDACVAYRNGLAGTSATAIRDVRRWRRGAGEATSSALP